MAENAPDQSSGERPSHWEAIGKSAEDILNVRVEVTKRQTPLASYIQQIGSVLGRPAFSLFWLALHLGWIVLNLPIYPWFAPWDPFPFFLLATMASVEAPFIALLILMDQEQDRRVAELREEVELQVSLHIEREMTTALRLLDKIRRHHAIEIEQDDSELEQMEAFMDPEHMMDRLRKDLERAEGDMDADDS